MCTAFILNRLLEQGSRSLPKLPLQTRHTVWRHACLRLCAALEQLGHDVEPSLSAAGLKLGDLLTPGFRVVFERYSALIFECLRVTQRKDLGIYINSHIPTFSNTYVQTAIFESKSPARAFKRFSELLAILDTSLKIRSEIDGNLSAIVFDKTDMKLLAPVSHFLEDLHITGVVRVGGTFVPSGVGPVRIEYQRHEPDDPRPWYEAFGEQIIWGAAASKVWWNSSFLYRPRVAHNEGIAAANFQLAKRSLLAGSGSSFIEDVKAAILRQLAQGAASQEGIAQHFGMEIRTLQRALKANNTTFQKLLAGVRKELALELLGSGKSVASISSELAFCSQSAFSSAFKTWFGQSPANYRKNL